jgi:hypothetical protein
LPAVSEQNISSILGEIVALPILPEIAQLLVKDVLGDGSIFVGLGRATVPMTRRRSLSSEFASVIF